MQLQANEYNPEISHSSLVQLGEVSVSLYNHYLYKIHCDSAL